LHACPNTFWRWGKYLLGEKKGQKSVSVVKTSLGGFVIANIFTYISFLTN
jgi:hypothetical protein